MGRDTEEYVARAEAARAAHDRRVAEAGLDGAYAAPDRTQVAPRVRSASPAHQRAQAPSPYGTPSPYGVGPGYQAQGSQFQGYKGQARPPQAARARRQPVHPRRLRFWRWFRTLPIVAMLVLGAFSMFVSIGFFGLDEWLYPLRYEDQISRLAERYGIDPWLAAAIVKTESDWDPTAQSSAGAQGLMQLLPETARELAEQGLVDASVYDPSNLDDPETNLAYGMAYLKSCLDNTETTEQAIAAYNAGLGQAQQWAASDSSFEEAIAFPETTGYLERVLNSWDRYQQIYPHGIGTEAE